MIGFVRAEKDEATRRVVRDSLTKEAGRHLTICEQLRFIYDIVHELPDPILKEELTERLVDAFNMGKKMNSRLAHYKRLYSDKTGSEGSNLIKLEHTEVRRMLRNER